MSNARGERCVKRRVEVNRDTGSQTREAEGLNCQVFELNEVREVVVRLVVLLFGSCGFVVSRLGNF